MQIPTGHKFAAIALPDVSLAPGFVDTVKVGRDMWATLRSPFPVTDFWRETIGSLAASQLEEANLFLITHAFSDSPDILDHENRALGERIWMVYLAMLFTGFSRFGTPIRLTGTQASEGPEVRSLGEIQTPGHTLGTPLQPVTATRLQIALEVADSLASLITQPKRERISRVFHAFLAGVNERDASNRLHQFVRCVEGFIVPDTGATARQFKDRTELFVGPRFHTDIGEIYDIRSSVEHLHGPYAAVNRASERERRLAALQRAVEAEEIARYCIKQFLLTPSMWPHFDTDVTARAFWSLSSVERQEIWGNPLDFAAVRASFDPRFIEDQDLGLPG